jgi:hypothetical protein
MGDRESLRATFDRVAASYADARPTYPRELIDALVEATGIGPGSRLVRHVDWETTYDADGYLALLDTFSGHIAMEEAKRAHLYAEIRRRLALRPDGLVRRHWGAVLHVAARLG